MTESPSDPARPGANAALAGLAQEAWDAEMASQPVFATSLGDRRFDDRLRPNGPDAIATDVAMASSLIARAEAIDPANLDATDVVTRAALIEHLSLERDLVEAGLEAWAVDPLDGPQVTFLNIASFQPIRDDADAEALLARWREMGPWIRPPRRRLARGAWPTGSSRREPSSGASSPSSTTSSPARSRTGRCRIPSGTSPMTCRRPRPRRFARDLPPVVADEIRPAFARYRAFLADELALVARADDRPGLGSVPGGDAAYARLVRRHTTLDLSARGDPSDRARGDRADRRRVRGAGRARSSGPATGAR